MRLIINRSQQDVKGMLGGHKGVSFTICSRLELTKEEADLVSRMPVTRSRTFRGLPVLRG